MTTTKQAQICAKLIASGCKEIAGNSKKYRTFKRSNGEFYFVGKNGALRTGKTVSDSISLQGLTIGGIKI